MQERGAYDDGITALVHTWFPNFVSRNQRPLFSEFSIQRAICQVVTVHLPAGSLVRCIKVTTATVFSFLFPHFRFNYSVFFQRVMFKLLVCLALATSTYACCGLSFTTCCQGSAYAPPRIIGYERVNYWAVYV